MKMVNFSLIFSASMHVIKRLMTNCDTLDTISKFLLDRFLTFSLVWHHVA